MKKFYLIILASLLVCTGFSQVPQVFNYQAALRGSDGQILADKSVKIRLSFLSGSSSGTNIYTEDHSLTTNSLGLININAGDGDIVSGSFSSITWSTGNIWLKVEIDENLTGTFIDMGATKLLSVPYALYAEDGTQGPKGDPGATGNGISSVDDNGNGTLTFNFTDNSSFTTPNLKGEKGDQGIQGLTGPQGNQGIQGSTGAKGDQGIQGLVGAQGEQGIQGPVGLQGEQGIQGPVGPKGEQGIEGPQGLKGDKGDAGTGLTNKGSWTTGTTYNPAEYVFALNTAQTANSMWIVKASAPFLSNIEPRLDLTNWVEFQAPQGEQGLVGPQGQQGPQGPQGLQGIQGVQGPVGPLVSGTNGQTLRNNGSTWIANSNLYDNGTNVGIGTTSPSQKLEVNGNIKLNGNIVDYSNSSGTTGQLLFRGINGVNWQSPSFVSVGGTGAAGQLATWSGASSLQGLPNVTWSTSSLQVASTSTDDPIFEVKNTAGQVVFGVYQGGVRVYVDTTSAGKGSKGGFAVGGLSNLSKVDPIEYFRITPDSARIYVKESPNVKGSKGGFAVGGLSNLSKVNSSRDMMYLTLDSARIYVKDGAKGAKGGFAVGGLSNLGKGTVANFMQLTPDNYFIGHQSGINSSLGLYNNFLGYQAGMSNTEGGSNSFIGYKAGLSNTLGNYNVFIGNETGKTNTTGNYNTFLGFNSGFTNNASYNSFLGYQSGKATSTGSYNSFVGYNAGLSNISGEKNVFMGFESGRTNTTGASNVVLGTNAGYSTNGSNNILIGESAGYSLTTGQHNTFIGSSAGSGQTYVLYNVMIGTSAGSHINTTGFAGSFNVFMGINAGYQLARSRDNTLLGSNAGYWIENGQGNTFVGSDAGRGGYDRTPPWVAGTNGSEQNTTVGYKSSENIQTGSYNVALGAYAGNANVAGIKNVFIGYQAGYSETGSNKLYISNSSSAPPLIFGDFSSSVLTINGSLNVTSSLSVAGVRKDLNWDAGYSNRLSSGSGIAPLTLTFASNTLTGSVVDGSISAKGAVQLSNTYNGTSQTLATTEKALTDGLATKVSGSGITEGIINLNGSGTLLSACGGKFVLTSNGTVITITNNSGTYCHVWWQGQQAAFVGGSITMNNPIGSTQLLPAFTANGQGMEVHMGLENGGAYCSLWISWSNSKIFGHYTMY